MRRLRGAAAPEGPAAAMGKKRKFDDEDDEAPKASKDNKKTRVANFSEMSMDRLLEREVELANEGCQLLGDEHGPAPRARGRAGQRGAAEAAGALGRQARQAVALRQQRGPPDEDPA